MKRQSDRVPGYDERSAGGGTHCESWHYAVIGERVALSLTVSSGIWPESVDPSSVPRSLRAPMGFGMDLHRADPQGEPCDYLERCTHDGWAAKAIDFFRKHGAATFEQPESFWLALEAELRELVGN